MPARLNATRLWTLVAAALLIAGAVSALQPAGAAPSAALTHSSAI